jgi:hypothetical protein
LAVQYTVDGEFGRRELIGQAVVIGEEGTVIASLALFPTQIPDEQMKDFKIIIPGDEEKELDAVFLGRDERCDRGRQLRDRSPRKRRSRLAVSVERRLCARDADSSPSDRPALDLPQRLHAPRC